MHLRVSEWAARIVSAAIEKMIPEEESVRWDVAVVPSNLERPSDPQIAIWLSIDEPESGLSMESTYMVSMYELDVDDITDHIRKTWDVCLVERMEISLSPPA